MLSKLIRLFRKKKDFKDMKNLASRLIEKSKICALTDKEKVQLQAILTYKSENK